MEDTVYLFLPFYADLDLDLDLDLELELELELDWEYFLFFFFLSFFDFFFESFYRFYSCFYYWRGGRGMSTRASPIVSISTLNGNYLGSKGLLEGSLPKRPFACWHCALRLRYCDSLITLFDPLVLQWDLTAYSKALMEVRRALRLSWLFQVQAQIHLWLLVSNLLPMGLISFQ